MTLFFFKWMQNLKRVDWVKCLWLSPVSGWSCSSCSGSSGVSSLRAACDGSQLLAESTGSSFLLVWSRLLHSENGQMSLQSVNYGCHIFNSRIYWSLKGSNHLLRVQLFTSPTPTSPTVWMQLNPIQVIQVIQFPSSSVTRSDSDSGSVTSSSPHRSRFWSRPSWHAGPTVRSSRSRNRLAAEWEGGWGG